ARDAFMFTFLQKSQEVKKRPAPPFCCMRCLVVSCRVCIRLPVFRTTPESRTALRSSLSSVLAQQREQLAIKGRNIRRLPAANPVAVANDFLLRDVDAGTLPSGHPGGSVPTSLSATAPLR